MKYINFNREEFKDIGKGTLLVNFLFQKLLKVNKNFSYMTHYTSRVNSGENINIINSEASSNVFLSFAASNGCYIQALNGIEIDSSVLFSSGVKLISANHDTTDKSQHIKASPIVIKKNVWLGVNVVILPGVEIGENSSIGAGSVVTKTIPPNAVAVGNPAKVIRILV